MYSISHTVLYLPEVLLYVFSTMMVGLPKEHGK